VISSIKGALIPLYNLIFAVKLAFKKREITELEVEYFFRQLFLLKNFESWRNIGSDLVNMEDRVEKTKFLAFKRELIRIYPEQGRKIIDFLEKELTQSFSYKQANYVLNFKLFGKGSEFSNLKLFQQINVGFVCPDHELKSKLIQLVYEQLSSVFNFTEKPMKLYEFVRAASWSQPIALLPAPMTNSISTICSIASYYGVNLEIMRSSEQPRADTGSESENRDLKTLI